MVPHGERGPEVEALRVDEPGDRVKLAYGAITARRHNADGLKASHATTYSCYMAYC